MSGVGLIYTQILRFAALPLTCIVLSLLWALLGASTALLGFKAGVINRSALPIIAQDAVSEAELVLPDGVTLGTAATNQTLVIIACVVSVCFLCTDLLHVEFVDTRCTCLSRTALPQGVTLGHLSEEPDLVNYCVLVNVRLCHA